MSTTCKVPNQLAATWQQRAATWQQRDTCSSINMKLKNENIDLNLKPKLVKTSAWQPYPPPCCLAASPLSLSLCLPLSLCLCPLFRSHFAGIFAHLHCLAGDFLALRFVAIAFN